MVSNILFYFIKVHTKSKRKKSKSNRKYLEENYKMMKVK